jgi:RNA polymerase-binding protein DksA
MTGEKKAKIEKAASKVPSKTAGKTAGKAPGKTASKTSGKAASKAPGKTAGKTASKAPVKIASRAPSKAPVKTVSREKTPQYTMSRTEWNAFIEKMEKLLQDEKSEIINTLIANNNEFKEIVDGMDPKDFADIASDDIDRKMIEMLGSQELKRLKLIESAQTRIKQGKYGHCIKCDRPIPPERLEAIPYALMCIDCKSEEERRNR